jgi:carbonic anhydrase
MPESFVERLKWDIPASFVVFLVALPLSLGIALASGAPLESGLVAAVAGGIVVSLVGGAPLQVSGPAAGLTVLVFALIQKHGFETTCLIVIAAGLFQMIAGASGFARLALVISPAILHAMLAGIGILIVLSQFHIMLGASPGGSGFDNLLKIPQTLAQLNASALYLGALTIGVIVLWNRFMARKIPLIPGPLIAIFIATLLSLFFSSAVPRVQIDGQLWTGFHFQLPTDWHQAALLLPDALGLMLVASAESLLCARATDKLHQGPRANLSKELVGQGLGNMVSGLCGGLPITGVIVRSSANVAAGAKSQVSAFLHGVWILLFATLFSGILRHIPLPVLAALLVFVGINLIKIREFKNVWKFREGLVYLVTIGGVVFGNILLGIGFGFALSVTFLALRLNKMEFEITERQTEIDIKITGSLSFLNVPRLQQHLQSLPNGRIIRIQLEVNSMDAAAIEAIRAWRTSYETMGGKVNKPSLDETWTQLSEERNAHGESRE